MRKIIFAGGGTAGHVMPNLALIARLRGEYECIYVGGDGMEKELCAERGVRFLHIDTVKLHRSAPLKNLAVPLKLRACVKSAERALSPLYPDLVFSKGGYAALPVVLAAKGAPVLAHESDLTPGLVTRLTARRAAKVLCAFEPCARLFKNGAYVGTPLRRELYFGKKRGFGFTEQKPVLLVMGGSSGAAAINACLDSALPLLTNKFNVLHITGKGKRVRENAEGYTALEFCDDMPSVYASIDLAVTRAGANALAELAALGIPALAVPLCKATRGDQLKNAEYYRERGAIEVLNEQDMTAQSLAACVGRVYNDRARLSAAMKAMRADGTERICDIIRELIEKSA